MNVATGKLTSFNFILPHIDELHEKVNHNLENGVEENYLINYRDIETSSDGNYLVFGQEINRYTAPKESTNFAVEGSEMYLNELWFHRIDLTSGNSTSLRYVLDTELLTYTGDDGETEAGDIDFETSILSNGDAVLLPTLRHSEEFGSDHLFQEFFLRLNF